MNDDHDDGRPINPQTGERIGPVAQPGYYPGFSTLGQQKFWDATTRALVLDRVERTPEIRFFDPAQARTLEALCERVLPQDDRDAAHRIPIVPQIDRRLHAGETDGYRYEDMPPDREAYRRALRAIDATARALHGRDFAALAARERDEILLALHDGTTLAAPEAWAGLAIGRFWMMLVADCSEAYYSHPWAWDEIGFGGPAYPRAYVRLERGEPESWEVRERRYAWEAPPNARSGVDRPLDETRHRGSPAQGGTH